MASAPPMPQMPHPGQIFLDHVGWFVHDMADVERIFGALGFPLTPYSVHGDRDLATGELKPVGTANRLYGPLFTLRWQGHRSQSPATESKSS